MSCLCHSGKSYSSCCEPFHLGDLPEKPVQLMRSRYCAYAMHLIDYIMDTCLEKKTNPILWKKELLDFAQNTQFVSLDILDESACGNQGTVTFHAGLKNEHGDCSFTEKSEFLRKNKKWYYTRALSLNRS